MIEECKKLFRRDRTYLLCLTGVIALVLLYGLTGCYKMIELQKMWDTGSITNIESYRAQWEILGSLWGSGDETDCYINVMKFMFWVVAAVLLVKWHMLEGRRGREFQKLLPVKASSYVTYDFICGILFIWIPHVLSFSVFDGLASGMDWYDAAYYEWLFEEMGMLFIVNTFLYVSLVFAKRITNSIPGALLAAFVIWFGLWWIGNTEFFIIGLPVESAAVGLFLLTVLCIPGAYICDKKRDISGNGTFSFMAAHYLILGALFYELAYVFSLPAEENLPGVAGGVLLAGAVCVGIHYVAKPKRL